MSYASAFTRFCTVVIVPDGREDGVLPAENISSSSSSVLPAVSGHRKYTVSCIISHWSVGKREQDFDPLTKWNLYEIAYDEEDVNLPTCVSNCWWCHHHCEKGHCPLRHDAQC